MAAAFTQKATAMMFKVPDQVNALHALLKPGGEAVRE
jgi:hypothetical protein